MAMTIRYIDGSLLAALKGTIGSDKYDFNDVMDDYLPEHVRNHPFLLDNWMGNYGEEVAELMEADIELPEDMDTTNPLDVLGYVKWKMRDAMQAMTGWDKVRLTDLVGPSMGSSNGLYIFTCPRSNTTWESLGVWADDTYEAIEELESWLADNADDMDDEDAAHEKELWLSSPAYALESD